MMIHEVSSPTILVLNDYCWVNGGASKIAIDEAVSLAESGRHVIFVGAVGPVCDALKNSRVKVYCLDQRELLDAGKNPWVLLQGLWNFKAAAMLRTICRTLDPATTIIHLHGYTKALTTAPVRMAAHMGFRVVCTLHDFFAACPNGALFDFVAGAPCARKCLSLSCVTAHCDKRHRVHKIYRVVRSFIQKYIGTFPSCVTDYITLSNTSAALLRPYLPSDARFYPLENLIETVRRDPVSVARNTNIVAVGRLESEKGIDVLLEAAQLSGTAITFIGDGPMKERVLSFPNTHVTGWVSPAEVIAHLEHARVLVFPSIWYEAYGLVVSEAAALGVPSIVSDVSAPSERIINGVHGWVVKAGDAKSLAAALDLIKDDTVVAKAGLAASARFWDNPPTRDSHISGLSSIYQKVLGS